MKQRGRLMGLDQRSPHYESDVQPTAPRRPLHNNESILVSVQLLHSHEYKQTL